MKKMLIILLVFSCAIAFSARENKAESTTEGISSKILRFHVIANSDSEYDQSLKLEIKDAVVTYLSPLLSDSNSLSESISIAEAHRSDVEAIAREIITKNGFSYSVSTEINQMYFPVKSYGDVTLPSGTYTAFCIRIGESNGKNWWCILYPPLCFVDASCGVVPDSSKKELEDILTEEEYDAILDGSANVTFKFKYLSFLNKYI